MVRVELRGRQVHRAPVPSMKAGDVFGMGAVLEEIRAIYQKMQDGLKLIADAKNAFESIKQGPPGPPGLTGKSDLSVVVQETLKRIPTPKDGKSPLPRDVAAELMPLVRPYIKEGRPGKPGIPGKSMTESEVLDAVFGAIESGKRPLLLRHVVGANEAIAAVRNHVATREGMRGGGDTVVAGPGVTITNTPNGNKEISASTSGNVVYNEVVVVTGTTFTLAHTPTAGTLRLYRGGARQQEGTGNDFTMSGANGTLAVAAAVGEIFLADYSY